MLESLREPFNIFQREFNSLDDLANSKPTARDLGDESGIGNLFFSYNRGFVGREFDNIEHAREELHGYYEPTARDYGMVKSSLDSVDLPQPVSVKRKLRWSEDSGDSICIDRLRSGQAFWQECRRTCSVGQSNVTIMCNVATRCDVDSRDILWRGAAAVALADWLEAAGYTVRLMGVKYSMRSYTNGNHSLVTCPLKEYGQSISEVLLANALSGWALRTLWFYSMSSKGRALSSGLGRAEPMTPEIADLVEPGAIICQNFFDQRSAEKWLLEQTAKFAENAAILA
jgi:hypothetical protein